MARSDRRRMSDANVQEEIITLLYAGHGRAHAAKAAGVTPHALAQYMKVHPEYKERVEIALDHAAEPVIAMLRRKAVDEDDVTAAREYLKHAAPPPRSEERKVTVTHELTVDPAKLANVQDLARELERRQSALDIPNTETS